MDFAYGTGGEAAACRHEDLRALEVAAVMGASGAIVDALLICHREGLPPPQWTSHATAISIIGSLSRAAHGRCGHPVKRHRQDVVHRLRFKAVVCVEGIRGNFNMIEGDPGFDLVEDNRGPLAGSMQGQYLNEQLLRAGATPDEVARGVAMERARFPTWLVKGDRYEAARRLLEGTAAGTGRDAIKASHDLVEHARRAGELPRFYLPSDEALQLLGWEDLAEVGEVLRLRLSGEPGSRKPALS